MKLTKTRLMEIVKEELKEWDTPQLAPEQQKVTDLMYELMDAIEAMGESNPEMSDTYIALFRTLAKAGLNIQAVARMA